jgi:hypothetical protein
MSLAPRRAFACAFLLLASLAWTTHANAQPASPLPSRRVIVLVVLPSAARLDASRLRVDIGTELGADVVMPDDALAPSAMGTLTVGLDASGAGGTITIRYETRAEPISRQMELPPVPDAAERAVVLLAGNLARDESAELALAVRDRRVPKVAMEIDDTVHLRNGGRVRGVVLEESPTLGVRIRLPDGTTRSLEAGEVDYVTFGGAPTPIRSDPPRTTVRFGVGGEPVLWYVPGVTATSLGARIFGRMNVDLTPLVAFRVDLGAAVLGMVGGDPFVKEETDIPISLRADLQFNITRHYAVGLGVDLGVDIYRVRENVPSIIGVTSSPATDAQGMLGFHVAPLTLRLGRASQFQVAAQEGVLFFLEQGDNPAFEQTLSFTYLFGSPTGT